MNLIWRASRNVGKGTRVNASTGGVSVSKRAGRVTVNSRGRASVRVGKGLSLRVKLW